MTEIRERARQSESSFLIGYSSGQDGHLLPARDFPPLSRKNKNLFWLWNKSFLSRLGPQKRKNSTLPFLMSSFNHEWNHFKEMDVWPQWTRVKRRIGAANYSKNQSKTRKLKPYQHDRETLELLPRCRDREPRMVSREHWGESLPESVQVIEENKRSWSRTDKMVEIQNISAAHCVLNLINKTPDRL